MMLRFFAVFCPWFLGTLGTRRALGSRDYAIALERHLFTNYSAVVGPVDMRSKSNDG